MYFMLLVPSISSVHTPHGKGISSGEFEKRFMVEQHDTQLRKSCRAHTHTHTHTYTAANVYAFDPSALYFVTKLMLNYVLSQTLH